MSIPRKLPIRIRSISDSDVSFVFNSWLRSFKGSPKYKHVENTIFYQNHHKIVQQCILRSQVLLACDENDLSQILGYIVADRIDDILTVHYVYVKQAFRGLGIASMLLKEVGYDKKIATIYTHATEFGLKLCRNTNFVFHPYIVLDYFKDLGAREYQIAQSRKEVIEDQKEVLEKLDDKKEE
jgi:GNAT superfamily N-acetyltransferase